ncbi:hypothetical protein LJC23_00970 [Desulfovibrio sp. OttesenSCG-928-I05]|nr:hypothetical protein [Desulfovibrio sp. OttesenSCG-928-I05]
MSLPAPTPKEFANLLPQELLTAVEAFLDAHYEFRCNPRYKGFFGRVRAFSDKFYAEEDEQKGTGERNYTPQFQKKVVFYSDPPPPEWVEALEEENRKAEEEFREFVIEQSFSTALMKLISAKGKDSVEVYKRAQIDRKLFSKIRSQHNYIPSKKTVIALALALELSLDETNALLEQAGFALSRSILSDVIIEFFISHGKYDIFEINSVLFAYKQTPLG